MPDSAQSGTIAAYTRAVDHTWVVWKFELRPWSIFLDMPKDAVVISAGVQGNDVVAWALCDPNAPKVSRLVAAHPTGIPMPRAMTSARFVATVQMPDGLVFHVFDGGEEAVNG